MKRQQHKKWLWWKHGVVYHIYPRSFFDSNKDGIGDIKGIINKLDYLEELGIDAIWISPLYKSPQVDFGYDVSDYRDIYPVFGTLGQFKALVQEAHRRGIKIIMDLILNHTSNEHPWFIESATSVNNPKRKWYLWRDGYQGKPPNNWKTSFGATAWEYHKETGQYYYHSFFKEQPDLNWRNKSLKKEMFSIVEYWLKMGVDGFRLDVANFIVKDKKFRDNPWPVALFGQNRKMYTRNRPRSIKTLKELRKLMDRFDDTMCVGEIFTLPPGNPQLAARYLGNGRDALHMAFDFSLIFTRWSAKKYAHAIDRWITMIPQGGWPCNVLSNHDLHRNYDRMFFRLFKKQKAIVSAFLLLTIKGTPFIYYGEEIGMNNTRIPRKLIRDPLGKRFWPFYRGRDQARSPMQWNSKKYAGFSRVPPWLPVNKNYKQINVKNQHYSATSILSFYKKLIQIRKTYKALHAGGWKVIISGRRGIFAYLRWFKEEQFLIVLNFRPFPGKIKTGYLTGAKIVLSSHQKPFPVSASNRMRLRPFEATLMQIPPNRTNQQ
jgi:alpha-glucosidase